MEIKSIWDKFRILLLITVTILIAVDIIKDITNKLPSVYLIPSLFIFLGALSNVLVIFSNRMRMPVRFFKKEKFKINSFSHFSYKNPKVIKFEWLTDRYAVCFIFPRKDKAKMKMYKISLGDILIFIGVLLILPLS